MASVPPTCAVDVPATGPIINDTIKATGIKPIVHTLLFIPFLLAGVVNLPTQLHLALREFRISRQSHAVHTPQDPPHLDGGRAM